MSEDIEWVQSEGRGKVWTFSIHHMGPSKAYKGEPPYVVALIEMDEGVKMMSNVVDVDPMKCLSAWKSRSASMTLPTR